MHVAIATCFKLYASYYDIICHSVTLSQSFILHKYILFYGVIQIKHINSELRKEI